jgi:hypothetical protein
LAIKTALLPIQKLAAKLRHCQFRNQQPTVSLLISEIGSNGGVISALLLCLFWVFTFSPPNIIFFLEIKGTRIDSASRFLEQTP